MTEMQVALQQALQVTAQSKVLFTGGICTAPSIRLLLYTLAVLSEARVIVELGSDEGWTTEVLACTGAEVMSIDVDSPLPERCVQLAEYPNVKLHICEALSFVQSLPEASVDLIFVDDGHDIEHVEAEARAVRRIVRPGGIAAFHDTRYFAGFWPMLTRTLAGWECINLPATVLHPAFGITNFGIGVFRKPS